ncbi:cytochrome P450 [Gigaspora margarita]|uniref:Cytochrome P450 n=1 Tax=Gigaspora margarita TaxID=4874 RepID=A0A8H3ZZR2_GIGMA|nr:cytochrome P450 [Gigaspora margarita]
MEILISVGVILLLYIAYYYYCYFTRPNPLPGPFPLPFIGTLHQIGLDPRKWEEKNLNKSIDIWELYAGPFRVIVPGDAKYVDKIYLSYNETKFLSKESKFSKRGIAAYDEVGILNGMVFNNNGHKWKRSRQFVTKILMSKKYHIGFINSSQKIFKEFEEQWDKNGVTTFDFSKWISLYKAKVTISIVIGQPLYNLHSFDSISKAAAEYVGMFAFLIFVPKIVSIRGIIQKRRDEIRNGSTTNFNLLDLLLITNFSNDSEDYIEGEQPMNDEEIEGNLAEITAFLLRRNPKVFGSDTNSIITYEALESCHYLDGLIKELLRHSNPGPFNLRVLDSYENVGNYHWSPGTWFFVDHHRIMNNPKYWNEPMKFNPDRFLSEEHGGTNEFRNMCKNGYVPFGGGLRICPGRNIAVIELKLLAVLFFRKYNIELLDNESIKYVYRATNQVRDFMIKLSKR